MARRAWLLAVLALVCGGCGDSGSEQNLPEKPPPALASRCGTEAEGLDAKLVWFRASDGALLDGAAVGGGKVGVVLAHEYPADLCSWLPFARTLADEGYLAFPFDFRGSGSSPSRFGAQAARFDRDVEAAAAEVRRLGAGDVVLVGASLGGAAVLRAGPALDSQPAGVISLSGEPELSRTLDAIRVAPKMKAPLLLLVARHDRYVSVADYRRLLRAAGSKDKRLVVYGGNLHGWDLLYYPPTKARATPLVLEFLRRHGAE